MECCDELMEDDMMIDCSDVDARVTEASAIMASWELVGRWEGFHLLG